MDESGGTRRCFGGPSVAISPDQCTANRLCRPVLDIRDGERRLGSAFPVRPYPEPGAEPDLYRDRAHRKHRFRAHRCNARRVQLGVGRRIPQSRAFSATLRLQAHGAQRCGYEHQQPRHWQASIHLRQPAIGTSRHGGTAGGDVRARAAASLHQLRGLRQDLQRGAAVAHRVDGSVA